MLRSSGPHGAPQDPTWGGRPAETWVQVLQSRAAMSLGESEPIAFTWLGSDADHDRSMTYAALDHRARAIGALLQDAGPPGERALLLVPPGLDFVAALFGCFYAGWIAVPAYPPPLNQRLERIRTVAGDARPLVALTSLATLDRIAARLTEEPELSRLRWLAIDTETVAASNWQLPRTGPEDLAMLQYTSGSTAAPRGVMLTHANLLHNVAQIQRRFEASPESRGLIWLPPYHDMGLVGGILEGVWAGFPIALMAPVAFLQRPRRWLEAITRTRATISGGPNFAYDLCVERISAADREGLDLSSWSVAFNGSEPVRSASVHRFAAAFGPFGFRETAFYPCYGLAEATLMAAGGQVHAAPHVLEREDGPSVVGCGQSIDDQSVSIVDPIAHTPCAEGDIGEIWLTGPSIAAGYWQNPSLTQEFFKANFAQPADDAPPRNGTTHAAAAAAAPLQAQSADSQAADGVALGERRADTLAADNMTLGEGRAAGSGPYLRTGDLGFLRDGELFVTGRLKAVLVLGGRKIHAEDIETTLAELQTHGRPGGVVALSIDSNDQERLVVIQEVRGPRDPEAAVKSIRTRIAEVHQLPVWAVVLTRPGGIPRTSSGKVQRTASRQLFIAHQFDSVYEWQAP